MYLEKKDRSLEITWSKQNESGNKGMENNYALGYQKIC
jgi:hypothetical protein